MREILKQYYNQKLNNLIINNYINDKPDLVFQTLFNKNMKVFSISIIDNKPVIHEVFEDYSKNLQVIDLKDFIKDVESNENIYSREFIDGDDGNILKLYLGDNFMFYYYGINTNPKNLIIYSDCKDTIEFMLNYIHSKPEQRKDSMFTYVTQGVNGNFNSVNLTINRNTNVSLDNYNDDIPYKQMLDFCNSGTSGLILMNGEAGTGKTSLIKKLIYESTNDFILMSADTLAKIDSTSFMSYLINHNQNSVLVLEDCDNLLKSRDAYNNNTISTLLNLSDGILGDALKLKFICTFNTDLSNIDKALMRKGRLKIHYVFEKLAADKVHKINPKFNKPMTLAELYNTEDNDFSKSKTTKIGFSK